MKQIIAIVVCLTLLLGYRVTEAAIAFVTAVSANGSATSITTAATSHTSGNLLYVFIRDNNGSPCPTYTISDTAGNTFTQIGSTLINTTAGQDCDAQFYAKNITGNASNQVTVTASASLAFGAISVTEFSGIDTTNPLDASATGIVGGGSTSITSGTFTTSQADELIVAGASVAALSGTFTAGSMGGTAGTIPSGATQLGELITTEYAIVSSIVSGGTAAISWTDAGRAEIMVATFKAAAGGGGGGGATPGGSVIFFDED